MFANSSLRRSNDLQSDAGTGVRMGHLYTFDSPFDHFPPRSPPNHNRPHTASLSLTRLPSTRFLYIVRLLSSLLSSSSDSLSTATAASLWVTLSLLRGRYSSQNVSSIIISALCYNAVGTHFIHQIDNNPTTYYEIRHLENPNSSPCRRSFQFGTGDTNSPR
jgi:hypothetical protein